MTKTTAEIVTLTSAAATHLKTLIEKKKGCGFRLSVKPAGCNGYRYQPEIVETVVPEDICIDDIAGVTVFIDRDSLSMLRGITIDYVSTGLGQSQLQYRNPHVSDTCGCGESFNLID